MSLIGPLSPRIRATKPKRVMAAAYPWASSAMNWISGSGFRMHELGMAILEYNSEP